MTNRVALIPARLGSQRLLKKNLRFFNGRPLIQWAIERCIASNCFNEIYVNSESDEIGEYALRAGVKFYKRPEELGGHSATSEDFVTDFLIHVNCRDVFQVHSITPLLTPSEITSFVEFCDTNQHLDTVLSCIEDQIEVAWNNEPVNFQFDSKTNSQELKPTQRVTWAITKWSRATFLETVELASVGTYSGNVGFYPVSQVAGIPVKNELDLKVVNALTRVVYDT